MILMIDSALFVLIFTVILPIDARLDRSSLVNLDYNIYFFNSSDF